MPPFLGYGPHWARSISPSNSLHKYPPKISRPHNHPDNPAATRSHSQILPRFSAPHAICEAFLFFHFLHFTPTSLNLTPNPNDPSESADPTSSHTQIMSRLSVTTCYLWTLPLISILALHSTSFPIRPIQPFQPIWHQPRLTESVVSDSSPRLLVTTLTNRARGDLRLLRLLESEYVWIVSQVMQK
jgi:hypothetical protein